MPQSAVNYFEHNMFKVVYHIMVSDGGRTFASVMPGVSRPSRKKMRGRPRIRRLVAIKDNKEHLLASRVRTSKNERYVQKLP